MDSMLNRIIDYLQAQSWQIGVLVAAIALISWALRHRSAHVRYLLWLIVLAKCLVPPVVDVSVPVLPEPPAQIAMQMVASPRIDPPATGSAVTPRPLPTMSPIPAPAEPQLSARQWLAVAWLVGMAIFAMAAVIKAYRTVCWLRRERLLMPDDVHATIHRSLSSLGMRQLPRMWLIEGVGQPFVWGLVRGDIYLPSSFLRLASDEHRRNVLSHEIGHVLRFDAAVNILQIVAQGLFWFHPLVWWANQKIRREREKCCDEMAIARLDARPKDYGTALVNALIPAQESTCTVPSLAIAGPAKTIEERIRTMMRPGKRFYKRPSLIAASIALLATLLTVPTALVLTARAQTEPPEAKTDSAQTLDQAATAGDLEQIQRLLAQGADVNTKDKDGSTPLHEAAGRGQANVVRLLLDKGANVEATDASGQTPLHRAASWGSRPVCEWFVAKGASVKATDNQGNTPLHAALGSQKVNGSLLEFLLAKGADVNARNEQGETPLHLACEVREPGAHTQQRADAADILLAHGAQVDATDRSGRSPLHVAVENCQDKAVALLLAKGADIEAKNAAGATPLSLAARYRYRGIVELLVNRGAEVNSANSEGVTPLHFAAQRGDNETVERLIAQGADVNAKDAHGETPALWAARLDRRDTVTLLLSKGAAISSIQVAAYLGDLTRVKGFLDSGVSVNEQDAYARTALQAAALADQKEVAEFLLSKGAQVNSANSLGMTPLHEAAIAGSSDVAELLIEKDAEIDARIRYGRTPLFFAARNSQIDMARLLIDHGADVNAKEQNGQTPLHAAARYGNKDLVLLLLDRGVDINARQTGGGRIGAMPTDEAVWNGHEDIVRLLIDRGADLSNSYNLLINACVDQQKDLVELLIRKGADVNSKAYGYTPAMQAIWAGYSATKTPDVPRLIPILKLLLDAGADPDSKDGSGWSLLHYACGNADLTKLLLDGGANPNIRTREGDTPLHLVADEGNTAVAQLLVSRGADTNAKNYYGNTPLSVAENSSDTNRFGDTRKTPLTDQVKAAKKEIAKLLREHGAKE